MDSTDRLIGLGTRSIALGAFIIAYVRWVPNRIAGLLDSPVYVGYLLSLQFAILIVIVFSILYILLYISELKDEIDESIDQSVNYYLTELTSISSESIDEVESGDEEKDGLEDVATDGGQKPVDVDGPERDAVIKGNGAESDTGEGRREEPDGSDQLLKRLIFERIETTGRGVLLGVFVGIPLGLLFGLDTTVFGGILGGLIGNEIEYQAQKRRGHDEVVITPPGSANGLNEDQLFELLKSDKRRFVVEFLDEEKPEASIDELAEWVAARETDKRISELSSTERQRSYVSLYQTHLPRLDEAEIIDYDKSDYTVKKGDHFDEASGARDMFEHLEGDRDGVSESGAFHILKSARRRSVLKFLAQEGSPLKLADLSELIAAEENDKTIPELTSSERKRAYVALYQAHLPKMDTANIVDFDMNKGVIRKGEVFEEVASAYGIRRAKKGLASRLAVSVDPLLHEPTYYVLISVLAIAIFTSNLLDWGLVSTVDTNIWFAVYTVLILVPLVYEITRNR